MISIQRFYHNRETYLPYPFAKFLFSINQNSPGHRNIIFRKQFFCFVFVSRELNAQSAGRIGHGGTDLSLTHTVTQGHERTIIKTSERNSPSLYFGQYVIAGGTDVVFGPYAREFIEIGTEVVHFP